MRQGLPWVPRQEPGRGIARLLGEIVELLHKFLAGKHGLLEVVAELDGVEWACGDTQLAECTTAKVVHILVELAFLLSVGEVDHLGGDGDGAVGTIALACAARRTTVASVRKIDKL